MIATRRQGRRINRHHHMSIWRACVHNAVHLYSRRGATHRHEPLLAIFSVDPANI